MTPEEWLEYGISHGYCGPPVCVCHDGIPMTSEEDNEWEENGEVCVHMIRPYAETSERLAVEHNHAPSVWRRSNAGIPMLNG